MMKKQQAKNKGTPITWDQLSKLGDSSSTPAPAPVATATAAAADSWEDEEFDNKLSNSASFRRKDEDVKDVSAAKDISEPEVVQKDIVVESDFNSYKVPDGLTWDEKQEYLMQNFQIH